MVLFTTTKFELGFGKPYFLHPYRFKPVAQSADSVMPEAVAAEGMEDTMGPVCEY